MEEPFFEPWPDADQLPAPDHDVDLPFTPPGHVCGVVVPFGVEVFRGPDTVVRVTHAVAYRRGVEVHVGAWIRPGTRRPLTSAGHPWEEQEPRVGFRLADGTRLGHLAPHRPPDVGPDGPATSLAHTGGSGGGLVASSSWWLYPLPEGDRLEVVVRWDHREVPESSAVLDLAAIRSAAEDEEVLWDPPAPPADGWFAYGG